MLLRLLKIKDKNVICQAPQMLIVNDCFWYVSSFILMLFRLDFKYDGIF